MSCKRPMVYIDRFYRYHGQNRAAGRTGMLTARQQRQIERMAHRESYRARGELPWTEPPSRQTYVPTPARVIRSAILRQGMRGSFTTHKVVILPGQKARQGKRIEREATL